MTHKGIAAAAADLARIPEPYRTILINESIAPDTWGDEISINGISLKEDQLYHVAHCLVLGSPAAYKAQEYSIKAEKFFEKGELEEGFKVLGHASHYLMDVGCPWHVLSKDFVEDAFNNFEIHRLYETWVDCNWVTNLSELPKELQGTTSEFRQYGDLCDSLGLCKGYNFSEDARNAQVPETAFLARISEIGNDRNYFTDAFSETIELACLAYAENTKDPDVKIAGKSPGGTQLLIKETTRSVAGLYKKYAPTGIEEPMPVILGETMTFYPPYNFTLSGIPGETPFDLAGGNANVDKERGTAWSGDRATILSDQKSWSWIGESISVNQGLYPQDTLDARVTLGYSVTGRVATSKPVTREVLGKTITVVPSEASSKAELLGGFRSYTLSPSGEIITEQEEEIIGSWSTNQDKSNRDIGYSDSKTFEISLKSGRYYVFHT